MSKFLIKASALAFVCFGTSQLVAATNVITIDLEHITAELPAGKVPFPACILDFSNPTKELASATQLVFTLSAANSNNTLTVPHLLYLISEGVAAESRAKPGSLGAVSNFLNTKTTEDLNAVYVAFEKIAGTIQLGQTTLTTAFASQESCNIFVTQATNAVLPALLKAMGADTTITEAVVLAESAIIPMISPVLFDAYKRVPGLAHALTLDIAGAKSKVVGSGGCFGCGGSKK